MVCAISQRSPQIASGDEKSFGPKDLCQLEVIIIAAVVKTNKGTSFAPLSKDGGEGEEENTREKFPNCLPLVNCQTCCHGKVCGTQEVLEITTCIAHLFSIAICPEHQVSKYTI